MSVEAELLDPEADRSGRNLTPQHHRVARDVFLEALELDAGGRSYYLDQVCGPDSRLRSEVESLLREAETVVFDAKTLTVSGFRCTDVVGLNPRFRIVRWIGTGGMGEVYEAEDLELEKSIAVKTIRPEIAARPEMIARFKREIQIGQEVTHSNVCRVYDLGQHRTRSSGEGEPPTLFMTMEMIGNAKTLSALMRERGPMPVQDVIRIGQQVASGVKALHAAGYIHRDLKPSNIMVSNADSVRKCRAVVTDLGLARSILEGHTIAAPGLKRSGRSGTPEYMAPEQIEGGPLTEATDIYSLGVILYQMSTGALPKKRHGSDVLEPPHSDTAPPKLPGAFARILRRCIAADPVDRFPTVEELNAALERINEQPAHKVARGRSSAWMWVAEALGVALVVLFGALVYVNLRHHPDLVAEPLTSLTGEEAFPSLSPDGNYCAFSWAGENQDNDDIYVKVLGGGNEITRLTTDPARDFSPAWSPNNQLIAYLRDMSNGEVEIRTLAPVGGNDRALTRIRMNSGEATRPGIDSTVTRELPVPYLTWSPDSKYLVLPIREPGEGPSSIWAIPVDGGNLQRLTSAPVKGFGDSSPVLSPDGKLIAFSRTTSQAASDVYLLHLGADLKPAGEPQRLTFNNRPIHGMSWGPGRTLLFSMDDAEGFWEIPAAEGAKPRKIRVGVNVHDLAFSESARRLVFTRWRYDYSIWRLPLGAAGNSVLPAQRFIRTTQLESNPQYSPDGKKVVYESHGSGSMEIWLADADGRNQAQLTKFEQLPTGTPRWSRDGKWIAFDHNKDGYWGIYVISPEGRDSPKLITAPPSSRQETNESPSWSQDGKWVYYASNRTGRYEVWKVPAAGGAAVPVTHTGGYIAFESLDGSRLYYSKSRQASALIEMPLGGGTEVKIADSIFSRSFTVTDKMLYFVPVPTSGAVIVKGMDVNTRVVRDVGRLPMPPFESITVSPDSKFLAYTQIDSSDTDLFIIDNF
jgi:Tol biopolymer transport system component